MLSSLKDEKQRMHKLSYPGNFEIKSEQMLTSPNNGKDAFIKTDQLYFFKKELLDYRVIGRVSEDVLAELLQYIEDGTYSFEPILDNLK